MTIKKVLVVDDSPTERFVIGDMLRKQGYQVIFAEDGEQGVAKSRTELPDLILMDIVMPGLNGFQATRTISRDPATQHIPLIICTTKGQETDRIWGMRQGAKDYILKPIIAAELSSKISLLG